MADTQYIVTKSGTGKTITVQKLTGTLVEVPSDAQFIAQDSNLPGVVDALTNSIYNLP